MSMELVELHTGNLELVLSPSIGGSIARFEWLDGDGLTSPLMRGCHSECANVLLSFHNLICAVLVPVIDGVTDS